MTNLKFRFTVVCDHYDPKRDRGCADSLSVNGDPKLETLEEFEKRARHLLKRAGWNVDGPTLCPDDNTTRNRKKKFPEVHPASLAGQMRALRLD